jgi:hypothetical protein
VRDQIKLPGPWKKEENNFLMGKLLEARGPPMFEKLSLEWPSAKLKSCWNF